MYTFLITFMALYGAMCLYTLRWLKPAFGWKLRGVLLYLQVCAGMLAVFFGHHVLDRAEALSLARLTQVAGNLWLLLMMWMVSFGLAAEAWNVGVRIAARFRPAARGALLSPGRFVSIMGVLVAVLCVWGVVEANALKMETISLQTDRMPPGARPLRVLHVSDLHVVPWTGQRRIDRVLRLAHEAQPDMVVCTGDLFDSPSVAMDPLVRRLAALRPPLGKLACFGNHEYYVGASRSADLLREAGFRVLRNDVIRMRAGPVGIVVAGAEDGGSSLFPHPPGGGENALLRFEDLNDFTILLKHQPTVSRQAVGLFNLQLSGHTHGGQVFPFQLAVRLFYPRLAGLFQVGDEAWLYVSPGAGTWGPPLRVLARPRVTLFDIRPAVPAPAQD